MTLSELRRGRSPLADEYRYFGVRYWIIKDVLVRVF